MEISKETTVNPIQFDEIRKKTVCIVSFNRPRMPHDVAPGRFFQVTIDPVSFSPDGKFVRFGHNPGDELLGWQPVDWIQIDSIIAEWEGDNPPQITYSPRGGVTKLIGHD